MTPTSLEFKRLDQIQRLQPTTWLIYGSAKSAKTWLAATAPRPLIIDTGAGLATIQSAGFKKIYPDVNPLVIQIREPLDKLTATGLDMVKDAITYALDNLLAEFDTLIIDDLTSVRKFAMTKGLTINQDTNKSQTINKIVTKYNVILPAVQDYGVEMALVEQFVAQTIQFCQEANKHLVILSHERFFGEQPKDKDGKPLMMEAKQIVKVRPAVTGWTFPDTVTCQFDNVLHTEVSGKGDQTIYRVRTKGDDVILAGVRNNGLWPALIPGISKEDMAKYPHGANLTTMIREIQAHGS